MAEKGNRQDVLGCLTVNLNINPFAKPIACRFTANFIITFGKMIEKNYNEALVNQDVSVKTLIGMLNNIDIKSGLGNCAIYHHFPIYPNDGGDNLVNANVLFVSQKYGVVIFQS